MIFSAGERLKFLYSTALDIYISMNGTVLIPKSERKHSKLCLTQCPRLSEGKRRAYWKNYGRKK